VREIRAVAWHVCGDLDWGPGHNFGPRDSRGRAATKRGTICLIIRCTHLAGKDLTLEVDEMQPGYVVQLKIPVAVCARTWCISTMASRGTFRLLA
jgi:hypothetical protein